MHDSEIVEADQVPGACHPRFTFTLVGQDEAEKRLLDAYNRGRLNHGWLINGPNGVGKATLAWRIAKFLLVRARTSPGPEPCPAVSLQVEPDESAIRHLLALTERQIMLLRRNTDPDSGRVDPQITVASVRELINFFSYTSADQAMKIAIIDCAEEMNLSSVNALLKLLEEPPRQSLLLLVCNSRSLLPETIISRCRIVNCRPLPHSDVEKLLHIQTNGTCRNSRALVELSQGSIGQAMHIRHEQGVRLYRSLVETLASFPDCSGHQIVQLARQGNGSEGMQFTELFSFLMLSLIQRTARYAVDEVLNAEIVPGERQVLLHLVQSCNSPQVWADTFGELASMMFDSRRVNIDNFSTIVGSFTRLERVATRSA